MISKANEKMNLIYEFVELKRMFCDHEIKQDCLENKSNSATKKKYVNMQLCINAYL